MKKIISATLAALLVFSLAACGNTKTSNAGNETQPTESNAPETTAPETQEDTDEASASSDESYEVGFWNDDVYTNEYLGFTFELPEGWELGTMEGFNAMQEAGREITGISEEEQQAAVDMTINDLYIINNSTGASMTIIAMNAGETIEGQMTTEEYLEYTGNELMDVQDQIGYEIADIDSLTIGTTSCSGMLATADTSELEGAVTDTMYQYYVAAIKGQYLINIIISSPVEGECESIIASMQPIQ